MKMAVVTLRQVPSFMNQAQLLYKCAVQNGYETKIMHIDQALNFKRDRFDHAVALIPLWATYIYGAVRLCAPWFSRTHYLYGPVDGPFQTNLTLFKVAKNYRIVTPSQWCADMLAVNSIPVVKVVPHGIDHSDFIFDGSPKYQRLKKLREDFPGRKILFSNVNPLHRKGFTHLKKAIELLHDRIAEKFIFVLHTGLAKARTFCPGIENTPNLLIEDHYATLPFRAIALKTVSCDIFVCSSLLEGFGEPILEAMAARKTIVCLDAPAMNELVSDKEAWLFPMSHLVKEKWDNGALAYMHQYDPKDLADAMQRAIEHPKESSLKADAAYYKSLNYDYRKVYKELMH